MSIQPMNLISPQHNVMCDDVGIAIKTVPSKRCFLKRFCCLRAAKTIPQQQNNTCKSVAIDMPSLPVHPRQCLLKRLWRKIPSIGSLVPSVFSKLVKKVWIVASAILNLSLGLMLYWTNNSLFAIGLIIGMAYYKQVGSAIDNIKAVWKTQPFHTALIAGFGSFLGGTGSFLSLPITIGVGSVLYSANLGANLSKKAQEILKNLASSEAVRPV